MLLAQAAAPVAEVKPEDRASVEGTVVDAVTGEPVRKAQVVLSPYLNLGNVVLQTDGAGQFGVEGLLPGPYTVHVSALGYVKRWRAARPVLGRKAKKTDVVIRLTRQGVISGRVLDEDGDPVPSVHVAVIPVRQRGRNQESRPNEEGTTNDLGEYRIAGLPPGSYLLKTKFSAEGVGSEASPVLAPARLKAPVPTFFPSTEDVAAAQTIRVKPASDIRGADIRLRYLASVNVSGHVEHGAAKNANRRIVLSRARARYGYGDDGSVELKDNGDFHFENVLPGEYWLMGVFGHFNDAPENTYVLRHRLTVGNSDVTGLRLTASLPPKITGRVKVEGPAKEGGSTTVWLRALGDTDRYGRGNPRSKLANAGSFAFPAVFPGSYRVEVTGDCYLKSATVNGQDVLANGLEVAAPQELELTIARDMGRVSGKVALPEKDGPETVVVAVWPASGFMPGREVLFTRADDDGAFELRWVPPGDYKIVAVGGYSGALDLGQDPAAVVDFSDKAETVTIAPNGQLTKTLKLTLLDEE